MNTKATGQSRQAARERTTASRFGATPRASTPYAVDTLMPPEEVVGNSIPFKKQRGFSAVYFLISAGEIIYVGQTVDLAFRIATHAKSKEFDSYSYILVPDDQLSSAEADYIVKFRPRLNSQMPLGGRYISEKEARKRVHFADLRRAVASGRLARHAMSFGAYFIASEVDAFAEELP